MYRRGMKGFRRSVILGCVLFSFLFTGCSGGSFDIDVDLDGIKQVKDWGGREKKSAEEELSIDEVSATDLDIAIDMGSIAIGYNDTSKAELEVKYEASGLEKDKLDEILEAVTVEYEMQKDVLQIRFIHKDTKESIWAWMHKAYDTLNNKGNYNLNVDLDLTIPSTVTAYEVSNCMGDIELRSLKGAFHVNNDMGSVKLKDITFTGDSDIQVDMGNIDCKLSKEAPTKAKIAMNADMGNVSLDTNGIPYTSAREDKDDDFMGGTETIIVDKLCTIEATVDMGDVRID